MTECAPVKMHTDDKVDNQSNNSAASSDSGVITDEKFMPSPTQANVDISTTITCENSDVTDTAVNIDNLLNLAKNVCPSKKRSPGAPKKTASDTPPKSSSPTVSIRSTNISIASLQSDVVSSVIDSDSDEFEDSGGNYTIKKLGKQTAFQTQDATFPHIGGGDKLVLLQQRVEADNLGPLATLASPSSSALATPTTPQVGNLAFTNSTDITIGQKNYYQGPVTIQQFLIENRKREGAPEPGGADNPAFQSPSPDPDRRKPNNQDARPRQFKLFFKRRIVIATAVLIFLAITAGVALIIVNSSGSQKATESPPTTTDPFKPCDIRPQPYKFIFNRRAAIITAVIIILTISLGVVFVTSSSVVKRKSPDNIGSGIYLRIVPRSDWIAEPAKEPLDKLKLPVHRVIISHTATASCDSQSVCTYHTRAIQQFHMYSRNFSDISYNFLVGGDGCVYEGRGWDDQGAHTKGFNVDSLGIAFIGTFKDTTPPQKQLNAAKLLIEEGVKLKKLVEDYKLYGARQLGPTESPGEALYAIIKTWPHWSNELKKD